MPTPIHVPRVNNNDDEVKLLELLVAPGTAVQKGQPVAAVETDKAVVDVEATADGFVLGFCSETGNMVTVGTVLAWLGERADEPLPTAAGAPAAGATPTRLEPTAKARALLKEHGLEASEVSASGDRLTAEDVLRHLQRGPAVRSTAAEGAAVMPQAASEPSPVLPGRRVPLRSDQKGMAATVVWHRDHAVPGYIETTFDTAPWEELAATLQQRWGLLLNPLLPLMAWRLVELARETPAINATLAGSARHEYDTVNLGFTVQAGEVLYLAVVRDAAALGQEGFVKALVDVQRRAAAHKLGADETQGSTIGFSSMSRWQIARHVPILAPHTAVMVAHTVDRSGQGVLGATYDHRVLHGADVALLLRKLGKPAALPA